MGSYKLLMQVLPPRDRMTVFKGQCELLSERSLLSVPCLTGGLQSLLGPQPEAWAEDSPTKPLHLNCSLSLLLWGSAFLLCQSLFSSVPLGILLLFLKQLRTWVGFFLIWEELKSVNTDESVQWHREAEPDTCHPCSHHTSVSFGRSGNSVSSKLLNWEFLWEHSVVLLVTKDERPYICLLRFINPSPK